MSPINDTHLEPRSRPLIGRSRVKRWLFHVFRVLERLRIHVLPRHFYSPVADRGWLQKNPELWRRPMQLVGQDWDLDAQLKWLEMTCSEHLHEVRGFSFMRRLDMQGIQFRYGPIEAQVLHCVIRSSPPQRVVELGSGSSTALMVDAVRRNVSEGRRATRILSVDPYAAPGLDRLSYVEVRRSPAQAVSDEPFAELEAGDLLFVDSTHVLKTGSELPRLYLEVVPRLAPGVLVQIHDVYLPYCYPPGVLTDFWDWQESAFIAALLTNNAHLRILCCQSALHDARSRQLRALLPDYRPRPMRDGLGSSEAEGHFPASIWLQAS